MPDFRAQVIPDIETGRSRASARPLPDRPFRILLLGDFTGRAVREPSADAEPLHERRPVAVDRDNVDEVMGRLRPAARLALHGAEAPVGTLTFESIDDFHPDRLLERVPPLRALVELLHQARAGRAVLPADAPARSAPAPAGPASAPSARGGSLLDQILEETGPVPAGSAPAPTPPDELQAYIRRIVAPHLVPEADPGQTALARQLEQTLAAALRALLHRPEFQALESVWRGVWFLVRRLETGARLQIFLLDVSRDELAADLAADRPVELSTLHRILSTSGPDMVPWAVLAGLYTFGGATADTELLARLAVLAQQLDAPLVAAAAPAIVGIRSFDTDPETTELQSPPASWLALRRVDAARWIGLALPRFLLRLPYDPVEAPVELLALEEMAVMPAHEDYLWGNPALLVALLLGESFARAGWALRPGQVAEVDALPLHLYRQHGATYAKPCGEALVNDRVAARMLDAGLMPVLSQKDGAAVRVPRFQSIAEPAAALAGGWDAVPRAR